MCCEILDLYLTDWGIRVKPKGLEKISEDAQYSEGANCFGRANIRSSGKSMSDTSLNVADS
jgi:hypothetical protein